MPTTTAPSTAPGMLPSPPTTAAAKTGRMARKPVSGSTEVSSAISIPPIPARPIPSAFARCATRSASIPLIPASTGLSATARMVLPVRVKARKRNSAAITATAMPAFQSCCGPMRRKAKPRSNRQSRATGRA